MSLEDGLNFLISEYPQPTTPKIPSFITNLAIEASSQHNDGWTMKAARDQLIEIRDFINGFLEKTK